MSVNFSLPESLAAVRNIWERRELCDVRLVSEEGKVRVIMMILVTIMTCYLILSSASKSSIRRFVITEKAPTRAFSWLKAATTAFTLKTLC